MLLSVLQLILRGVAAFARLLALVTFRGAALLIVSIIQLFKAPGDGFIGTGVGLVKSTVNSGYTMVWDVASELVYISRDFLMQSVSWVFYLVTSGVWELLGFARAWVVSLTEVIPGFVWNLLDIVGGFGLAVWSQFWDAAEYIIHHVR